jgi:hypothetical protein
MKLFRVRRKPKSGEDNKELVLDTEVEPQAPVQDETGVEVEAEAPADTPAADAAPTEEEAPAAQGDLLTRIGAEADSEVEAEGGSPQEEEPLDPELLDIFREAKNEVLESTLASELEDIPAQDLLTDLMGVSRQLGTALRARARPDKGGK